VGERELRKILSQYLPALSSLAINTFLDNLRTVKAPESGSIFRKFKVDEVI